MSRFTTTTGREYWGSSAAGIMFFSGGKVLLALRSELVDEPGTWGITGGAIRRRESPYEGALRETREELGYDVPPHLVFDEVLYEDGGFRYTNFLARVAPEDAERWAFVLRDPDPDEEPDEIRETDEVRWFPVDKLPGELHFGVVHVVRERPGLFQRMTSPDKTQ